MSNYIKSFTRVSEQFYISQQNSTDTLNRLIVRLKMKNVLNTPMSSKSSGYLSDLSGASPSSNYLNSTDDATTERPASQAVRSTLNSLSTPSASKKGTSLSPNNQPVSTLNSLPTHSSASNKELILKN